MTDNDEEIGYACRDDGGETDELSLWLFDGREGVNHFPIAKRNRSENLDSEPGAGCKTDNTGRKKGGGGRDDRPSRLTRESQTL